MIDLVGTVVRGQGAASRWGQGDTLFSDMTHGSIHLGTINVALDARQHECLRQRHPLLGAFQGADPRSIRGRRKMSWRECLLQGARAFIIVGVYDEETETSILEIIGPYIEGIHDGAPVTLQVDPSGRPQEATCPAPR